jgi:alkylhydroperoxidase family enzyme
LSVWRESPFFTARERAALAWTEALTLQAQRNVDDAVFEAMKQEFSDKEIADLTVAVGSINAWNRIGVGFAMQPAV